MSSLYTGSKDVILASCETSVLNEKMIIKKKCVLVLEKECGGVWSEGMRGRRRE